MPNVDWSEPEQKTLPDDGIYTFEIETATLKISKNSGMEYISLHLLCVDNKSISVFDNLSFSPQAKGILQAKLSALDMKGIPAIEADMFPGRRIKAAIVSEKTDRGGNRMVVDISAPGSKAGYFPSETEGGPTKKFIPVDDLSDDIPF